MKTIFLSPEIKDLFIDIINGDSYFTRAYLLGMTRYNTVRRAIRLLKSGGCDGMPSIGEQEMVKAYLKIVEEGLIPNGIARIGAHIGTSSSWYSDCGSAIFHHPGMIFIGIKHSDPTYWRAEVQPVGQKYWETKRVVIKMRKI